MGSPDRAFLFQQIDRLYRGGAAAAQDDTQLLALFLRDADQQAFEALVRRHGPMVLALCRKLLRDPRDIEDAFQATFLVLARRAGTIRDRTVLSSWLYGVAYRVATRCRSDLLRRRAVEISADVLEFPAGADARPLDELGPALHQEVNCLPEKYRAPIVLCYFQDQTHDQAAAELNWPVGTVRSRLARGRELLRGRLTRRGCTPTDVTLGLSAGLSPRSFLTQVPTSLMDATLATIGRLANGAAATGGPALALSSSVPGSASTLAQGVLSTMAATQYSWIGSGVAALVLVAGGTGVGALVLAPAQDKKPGEKPAAVVKPAEAPVAKASSIATTLPAPGTEKPEPDVSARLAELERKLDMLLRMQGGQSSRTLAPLASPEPSRSLSPLSETRAVGSTPAAVSLPAAQPLPSPAAIATSPTQPRPEPASDPFHAEASPTPLDELSAPHEEGQPAVAAAEPALAPTEALVEPQEELMPVPARRRSSLSATPDALSSTNESELSPFSARPTSNKLARSRGVTDPSPVSPTSLYEIEVQIQIAQRKIDHNRRLRERGVISNNEAEMPVDELRLLIARLRGMNEALTEATEQSTAEQAKLNAELDRIKAQLAVSTTVTARNERLNHRKPGMVSEDEVAKAEAETMAVKADLNEKEAEIHLAALRLKQMESRSLRIRRLIEATVSQLKEVEPPTPAR